ncbi:hypothetical protein, partial [Dysgonomonas sp. HGC4]|uniref:hypothetical protein n=1 Tax=Dysgonomonas sp. HGC4 TaxID=1658009 RepID=UPI001C888EBD
MDKRKYRTDFERLQKNKSEIRKRLPEQLSIYVLGGYVKVEKNTYKKHNNRKRRITPPKISL